MAFPADYHMNDALCTKQMSVHRWSTMGHPLKHRCVDCHKLKWVRNPEEPKTRNQGIYLPHVRS